MGRIIKADFHIHSCLSPCGDLSMSPSVIVDYLKQRNVKLAALTDHNSSLNCKAFAECCVKNDIIPLFGMELQTQEEIHLLCLFDNLEISEKFSNEIYDLLPSIPNNPEKMGDQVYVDSEENILGEVEKYLVTSADLSIDDAVEFVHKLGGIAIPAHADRSAFSLTSQFGMITDGNWDAVELVNLQNAPEHIKSTYPLTSSSDAHYIEHIARRTFNLEVQEDSLVKTDKFANINEVKKALEKLIVKNLNLQ